MRQAHFSKNKNCHGSKEPSATFDNDIQNNLLSVGRFHHLSLSVASPISARISEMIQNRITICGSAQPFFS